MKRFKEETIFKVILRFALSAPMLMTLVVACTATAHAQNGAAVDPQSSAKKEGDAPQAKPTGGQTQAALQGFGTTGRISKFGGGDFLINSVIQESSQGNIGIGTITPTSKLTVAGVIESNLGGFKFPDGTLQFTSGLASVVRDATLAGNGSAASPLGIANGGVGTNQLANNAVTVQKIAAGNVVKQLNGLTDNVTLAAGSNITITPSGNTLTIASTVADPVQNAFQRTVQFNVSGDSNAFGTITVPAGKRLAIEYLTIDIFGGGECQPMVVFATVAGVNTQHSIQLPIDDNGFAKAVDKPVRIYADTEVNFLVISRSGGGKLVTLTVSGFLVDLP